MISVKPTKNFTGITVMGDYLDLTELVTTIYNVTINDDDHDDLYYGVNNRLLGFCYDIRHASMRDRNIILVDNGIDEYMLESEALDATQNNIYYSVEILFPEALLVAAAMDDICSYGSRMYGSKRKDSNLAPLPFSQYLIDKARLEYLTAAIFQALGEVIGDEELEKLMKLKSRADTIYANYLTQYIDKCNMELLKTPVDKRTVKLKNLARRIIKKPEGYYKLEKSYREYAWEHGVNIYNLHDPKISYPEEIEW